MDNVSRQLSQNSNQLKEAYYALDSLSLSNYVCNISCGSLEIDIMLDKGDLKEIKLNNDIINITCCYDSLAALVCLIQKYLQSDSSSSSTNSNSNSTNNINNPSSFKCDPDLLSKQRENADMFNDDYLNSYNQNRHATNVLNELDPNSILLNTPPNSNPTANSETPSPLLYDPSFLDDDEEDLRINAQNQVKSTKQDKKETSDSGFYILGHDDFGTGIKVSFFNLKNLIFFFINFNFNLSKNILGL